MTNIRFSLQKCCQILLIHICKNFEPSKHSRQTRQSWEECTFFWHSLFRFVRILMYLGLLTSVLFWHLSCFLFPFKFFPSFLSLGVNFIFKRGFSNGPVLFSNLNKRIYIYIGLLFIVGQKSFWETRKAPFYWAPAVLPHVSPLPRNKKSFFYKTARWHQLFWNFWLV